MPKKWYHYLVTQGETAGGTGDPGELSPSQESDTAPEPSPGDAAVAALAGFPSFDEIYAAAKISPPGYGYTIFKVADMLKSEHIASLPADVKRKSVLLALDAAGVSLKDVIQDAARRDHALDTFERTQQKALKALEAKVRADGAQWQEEIDRLIAERQAKIRASNEDLAREAAAVQAWRERKAVEETRIADAIGHFVTDNPITIGTADLEPSPKASDS